MRYLEFSTRQNILEVSNAIVNQYRLVEAISDDDLETILQRINQELIREIGTNPKPTALRSVLVSHGFKRDMINQILAGIDAPKTAQSKKSTAARQAQPEEPNQPREKPAATEPSQPREEPTASTFKIKASAEDAKKILKNLSNQYPGVDQDIDTKIRSIARSAISGIDSGDNNLVSKALNSQLELINQEIAKLTPKSETVIETSSAGSTGAGSISSVSAPLGAIIRRMPPGQSFFSPHVVQKRKKTKHKKSKKH